LFLLNRYLYLSGDFLFDVSLDTPYLKPLICFADCLSVEHTNINIIWSKKSEYQMFQAKKTAINTRKKYRVAHEMSYLWLCT